MKEKKLEQRCLLFVGNKAYVVLSHDALGVLTEQDLFGHDTDNVVTCATLGFSFQLLQDGKLFLQFHHLSLEFMAPNHHDRLALDTNEGEKDQ